MTEQLKPIRDAVDLWGTARFAVTDQRTYLSTRGSSDECRQNTHPTMQPLLREERSTRDAVFAAVIEAAKRGADLGAEAETVLDGYPEALDPPPHAGVPQGRQSQKMRDARSRWASGRNKLVLAVLRHIDSPIQTLEGARAEKVTARTPGAVAAQQAMQRAGMT